MTDLSQHEAPLIDGDGVDSPHVEWHARLRSKVNPRYVYAILDQFIVSCGNLFVYASVARHCPTAEYGIFYLALRSLDILNQLCNVLIWGPFTFNLPQLKGDRGKWYLGSAFVHQLSVNAFGVVVLLAFAAFTHYRGDTTYSALFLPLAVPSVLIIFREFTRRMYFSQMRFRNAFFTDAATTALQIAGVLYLVHRHTVSYAHALWVLSASCLAVSLYWLMSEGHRLHFNLDSIRNDFKLNLQLGRWFFGSNMLFVASAQANPWILTAAIGPASVAGYAFCDQVVTIPRVALTSIQNTMAPSMSRAVAEGGKEALRKVVARMDRILIAGSAAFTIGIMLFGPWVSRTIFHHSPEHARLILCFLALNLLAYAAALAQSYGLSAINRAQLNFYAGIFGLVVQLVLAVVLVHRMGVAGVALALFAGSLVVLGARIFYYMREMRRA